MNILFISVTILLPIIVGLLLYVVGSRLSIRALDNTVVSVCAVNAVLTVIAARINDFNVTLLRFGESVRISFGLDGMSRLFSVLITTSMLIIVVYAVRCLDGSDGRSRFFAFYLITGGMLLGLAYSGSLATMYIFLIVTALASLPLIVHKVTPDSVAAGKKTFGYMIVGGLLALTGTVYLVSHDVGGYFVLGGTLQSDTDYALLPAVVFVSILGFGVFASIVPLHSWSLSAVHEAPAPETALLSGVTMEAGAFCIIRLLVFTVDPRIIRGTWVQYAFTALAMVTIFTGSVLSVKEKDLLRKIAYINMSQLSYILLGVSVLDKLGLTGALLHMVFQNYIICGFTLVAGAIVFTTGSTDTDNLTGLGRKMPITFAAFTILTASETGLPPCAGFLSRWFLSLSSLKESSGIFIWLIPLILVISTLFTANSLLSVAAKAFMSTHSDVRDVNDPPREMTITIAALTAFTLLLGIFASPILDFIKTIF